MTTNRAWAGLLVVSTATAVAAVVAACGGGASEGEPAAPLPADPAPTSTATTGDPPEPPEELPPQGDGGADGGRTCPLKWSALQYGGTWDKTKDVLTVLGGELRLEAKAQAQADVACESSAYCQPLRVYQQVTGDFDVSVKLKSLTGTHVTTGPNSPRIPVAGLYVLTPGATNYSAHHAHATIRFDSTGDYDLSVFTPQTLPGGSTQGDPGDVTAAAAFRLTRTGNSLSLVVDFTEKGGGSGKRTVNFRMGDGVDSAGPLLIGLVAGANFAQTKDIDVKASFDDFVVTKGTGLVADAFDCHSLP